MIQEWVYEQPDFAARLKAIPQPNTGLRSSLRQGLKLDLMFAEDERSDVWMIHYALLDTCGNLLSQGEAREGKVKAYFRVVNPELRVAVYGKRIKLGTGFYVVIGSHKVAEGVITEVLH